MGPVHPGPQHTVFNICQSCTHPSLLLSQPQRTPGTGREQMALPWKETKSSILPLTPNLRGRSEPAPRSLPSPCSPHPPISRDALSQTPPGGSQPNYLQPRRKGLVLLKASHRGIKGQQVRPQEAISLGHVSPTPTSCLLLEVHHYTEPCCLQEAPATEDHGGKGKSVGQDMGFQRPIGESPLTGQNEGCSGEFLHLLGGSKFREA